MNDTLADREDSLRHLVGRTIAERYRVDGLIGLGGMGAVFRGHHLGLRRDVAIKVLHPDLSRSEQVRERFDTEAHSASRLDHPNCIQVTDYGSTDEGMKFLVMQLLEGHELSNELGLPMAPKRALQLTLQIVRGLEHAHDHGVVHRDLKPENVLIVKDRSGKEMVKLVDFGIAKILGGGGPEKSITKVGLIFGTPQYMSPEQAAGGDIDERSDLYACGIIFYQMLAGHPPFSSDDPVKLVRMQVSAEPPPLPEYVPPVLARIVGRLLRKDRDERFPNAKALREELELLQIELYPETSAGTSAHDLAFQQAVQKAVQRALHRMLELALAEARHRVSQARTLALESLARVPLFGRLVRTQPPNRVLAFAAGGVLVPIVLLFTLLGGDEPSPAPGEAPAPATAAPSANAASPAPPPRAAALGDAKGATPVQLAEIDRLLLGTDVSAARAVLEPLRDQFPADPRLLWRQGRLFTKQGRKEAQALASYGDAIDREPGLLDDRDFYAELLELLRIPTLEQDALNLALRKMGHHGYTFLLELVNREKHPIALPDRQRVLEELRKDPKSRELIHEKLAKSLDLEQAHQSLAPCSSYATALAVIEAAPDPYYRAALRKDPPHAKEAGVGATDADAVVCASLPEARARVLQAFDTLYGPEPEAKPKKRSRRRRR